MARKVPTAAALSVVFVVFLAFQVFFALAGIEDSWVTKEPLPMGCWDIVGVNDKIYAIAGAGDYANLSYFYNAVLEYETVLDTWAAKKPMLIKRYEFATAVYLNKIYVIGGPDGMNQVYDPAADTWENRTSMPTPRTQFEANVVNGKIYVIGGNIGGASPTDVNEVYDPANDSWTTKAAMPTGVFDYASAVVDGKIYFIGGSGPKPPDLNQIYDPATDTWRLGTPVPTPVISAAAGATSGERAPKRIYILGGRINYGLNGCNLNQVYIPENDSWTVGAPMPTARDQLHVAVLNDEIYAMGGLPFFNVGGIYSYENEQYTPIGYGTPEPGTPEPSASPQPQPSEPFPVEWIAAAALSVAIVSVVLIIYLKKRSKS